MNGIRYINAKFSREIETIDEVDPKNFETLKEFHKYVRFLVREYRISGHPAYSSSRCTNEWRN
jgi:hypothetical protein